MSDEKSRPVGVFDVSTVERLVQLMSQHDLGEIDIKEGDARLRLRRGALPVPLPSVTLTHSAPAAPASAPATPAATTAPAPPARKLIDIISPAPGTFYNREKPEAAPYVQIGSRVSPTTVVGLLEAMKLYSEILAECSGVIVEALAENGQAVEYGTILFRVDPTS